MDEIFGVTGNVNWLQECARAALVFFYGLLLLRLAGRRLFGKWAAIDIIVSIIIGSNLSRTLTGNAALWGTLAATTLLVGLHWALSHAAARWRPISHLLEGRPIRLGDSGEIAPELLIRHSVSEADLNEALRSAGVENSAATRLVVIEPSGKLTVLKSDRHDA